MYLFEGHQENIKKRKNICKIIYIHVCVCVCVCKCVCWGAIVIVLRSEHADTNSNSERGGSHSTIH